MAIKFANNAKTTLAGAINSGATSLSVASAANLPTLAAGDYFYLTLEDASLNREIVKVTARSGTTLTVTRAQEGTTARSFAQGDKAEMRLTAAGLALAVGSRAVLSYTELKALTLLEGAIIVQYKSASADAGGGIFEWVSGSQSVNVALDPAEALYVAPSSDTSGASGAWRRVRDGAFASAAWFGIRGDSGTTSNTPTMFQRMEDTCNSFSIKEIRYEEYNYYWSDTIILRRNFMRHRGLGASQTVFTFNHTNNGIQYGDDTLFCYRPTVVGITYAQASGSAFCHFLYHGRELTLDDYINGSDVRNFIKIGSTRVVVTNIANNGSGLIRITVGSAQTWQTGMKVAVTQVDGDASLVAALAAIQFSITRISSTVFDLQSTTFAGVWTTGGVIGPFTTCVEFVNESSGDAMKIRGTHYVALYSLAGTLLFIGSHTVESPSYAAGSRGIEFMKNTSAFERTDFILFDNVFLRRFEKGILKDNCRVVSMRGNEVMLDECETGLELLDDDATADTHGIEELVFGKMRVGYDPAVSSATAIRLKATQGQQTEISVDQLNVTGTGTLLDLEGGTGVNGVQSLRIRDLLLEMRPPTATTTDAITIAGNVNFIFDTIVARAQGAGTERDVVRIADSWAGYGQIGGVQMVGLSGYGVTVGASVVAATASLFVDNVQNQTTAANRISDSANIAQVQPSPPRRGSATYDPTSLADGAGVTTTVTVTGAALGDFAAASFSLDLQGITVTSWVSAANTVSVRFQNETGGTIDLGSGTIRAIAQGVA